MKARNGWIKVGTVNPKQGVTVLIHCDSKTCPVWLGYFQNHGDWRDVEGFKIKVHHWQPLPTPPAPQKLRKEPHHAPK